MKIMRLYAMLALMSSVLLQAVVFNNNSVEIRCTDCSSTPKKVIFYGKRPVKAKKFIRAGFRPVHVIVHNQRSEPIVISANSVGQQQPTITDVMQLFKPNALTVMDDTLFPGLACVYITGALNVYERKYSGSTWYPMTIGASAVSAFVVSVLCEHAHNKNVVDSALLKKYFLFRPITIAANAKSEITLLIDGSVTTGPFKFDVFDASGTVVATFGVAFPAEGVKK